MLKYLLPLILWAAAAGAYPAAVENAPRESEFVLVFARQNFRDLLAQCQENRCALGERQIQLLNTLMVAGWQMPEARFESSTGTAPYTIDSTTGYAIFNRNQLWIDPEHTMSLDIPSAVSLWIQVLNETFRWPQADVLPLQKALRESLALRFLRAPINLPGLGSLDGFSWRQNDGSDRFFIRDSDGSSYDYTVLARAAAGCGGPVIDWQLVPLSWTYNTSGDGSVWLQLEFSQSWTCDGTAKRARGKLVLRSVIKGNRYLIDADSAHVTVNGE